MDLMREAFVRKGIELKTNFIQEAAEPTLVVLPKPLADGAVVIEEFVGKRRAG